MHNLTLIHREIPKITFKLALNHSKNQSYSLIYHSKSFSSTSFYRNNQTSDENKNPFLDIVPPKNIAIIGGGISGLSCAYYLKKINPSINITIYEKSSRAGGFINSTKEHIQYPIKSKDGEIINETSASTILEWGPRTLRTVGRGSQATMQLGHELGITSDIVFGSKEGVSKKYILENGKVQPIFKGLNDKIFGALVPLLIEPFRKLRKANLEDEDVNSFIIRRFGKRAAIIAAAISRGTYGGDSRKLSARSSFTKPIWNSEWNWRSTLLGFVFNKEVKRKVIDKCLLPTEECNKFIEDSILKTVYSYKNGLQELPEVLRNNLIRNGVKFITETNAKDVFLGEHHEIIGDVLGKDGLLDNEGVEKSFKDDKVIVRSKNVNKNIETESFDHVICAVPSYEAADLLSVYDVHDILTSISHVNMLSINVVLRSKSPLKGFGYLVPWNENKEKIYGCIFDSEALPDQDSPKGMINRFTIMAGSDQNYSSGQPDRYKGSEKTIYKPIEGELPIKGSADENAMKLALDSLKNHLNIEEIPLTVQIVRHYGCIGQHELGHYNKMYKLRKLMINGPLCNKVSLLHTSYQGIGVNASIQNARELAEYLSTLGKNKDIKEVTGLEFTRSVYKLSTI